MTDRQCKVQIGGNKDITFGKILLWVHSIIFEIPSLYDRKGEVKLVLIKHFFI